MIASSRHQLLPIARLIALLTRTPLRCRIEHIAGTSAPTSCDRRLEISQPRTPTLLPTASGRSVAVVAGSLVSELADLAALPNTCSNNLVDVRRPDWWCYPTACQYGHEWAPGTVIVSWTPCDCANVRTGDPPRFGHLTVSCQAEGLHVPLVSTTTRPGDRARSRLPKAGRHS